MRALLPAYVYAPSEMGFASRAFSTLTYGIPSDAKKWPAELLASKIGIEIFPQ